MQTISIPVTQIKTKRQINPEVQAKGVIALEKWRKEKAKAHAKGGKTLANWIAKEEAKKAARTISPLTAIRNFCIDCVGGSTQEVTNCSNKKCNLYIHRPYQL